MLKSKKLASALALSATAVGTASSIVSEAGFFGNAWNAVKEIPSDIRSFFGSSSETDNKISGFTEAEKGYGALMRTAIEMYDHFSEQESQSQAETNQNQGIREKKEEKEEKVTEKIIGVLKSYVLKDLDGIDNELKELSEKNKDNTNEKSKIDDITNKITKLGGNLLEVANNLRIGNDKIKECFKGIENYKIKEHTEGDDCLQLVEKSVATLFTKVKDYASLFEENEFEENGLKNSQSIDDKTKEYADALRKIKELIGQIKFEEKIQVLTFETLNKGYIKSNQKKDEIPPITQVTCESVSRVSNLTAGMIAIKNLKEMIFKDISKLDLAQKHKLIASLIILIERNNREGKKVKHSEIIDELMKIEVLRQGNTSAAISDKVKFEDSDHFKKVFESNRDTKKTVKDEFEEMESNYDSKGTECRMLGFAGEFGTCKEVLGDLGHMGFFKGIIGKRIIKVGTCAIAAVVGMYFIPKIVISAGICAGICAGCVVYKRLSKNNNKV